MALRARRAVSDWSGSAKAGFHGGMLLRPISPSDTCAQKMVGDARTLATRHHCEVAGPLLNLYSTTVHATDFNFHKSTQSSLYASSRFDIIFKRVEL